MSQPSISVVIPVFNGEKFLHQAISSALQQTYPPHEIIVVDDGSSDATGQIAASFGSSIRFLKQVNQGPSAARNLGTQASTGNWIAFLDADDLWFPDKLAMQVAALEAHPDAGLLYTGRVELHPDGRTTEVRAQPPAWVYRRLAFENPIFPSTVLARRSLMLEHPWPTDFKSSEDWASFYRLSRAATFVALEAPTITYRLHPDSLTHRNWQDVLHYAQAVAAEIQGDLTGLNRMILRRKVNSRLFASAAIAARQHRSPEYLGYITRSLLSWPFPDVWPARYKLWLKMLQQRLQGGPR